MADPLYSRTCDPLTGLCYDLNTQTGEYRLDPNTGQPISIMDPSQRTTTAQQAQGTAAPSRTPVSQDPYTDYETQRAIGVNQIQPTTPLPTYVPEATTSADLSTSTGSWNDYYGGYNGGYGSGYGGYSSGGYTQPEPPRYANGQTHPFFGGPALVPGGQFAAQDQGYDTRQQVRVPGGATAGPFEVSAAPLPHPNYNGGGPSGGEVVVAGGASPLYYKLRDKLMGGGSSSSSGYENYRQPRPYRGPDDPRTARKVEALQLQESQKASSYSQPTQMMPDMNLESPVADYLQGLPMTDLTLVAGAGKRNWAGGIDPTADIYESYYKKLNSRLKKGKPGIDFLPFYKKALRKDKSTEQFNSLLKNTYANLTNGQRWDTQALMQNLTNPAKGTFLHDQQRKTPFSQSSEQFLKSYGAILGSGGFDDDQQNALAMIAQDAVTRYGQQYGQRNPKRAPSVNQYVGSAIAPYMRSSGGAF